MVSPYGPLPPEGSGQQQPGRAVRARDVVSITVIGVGAVALLACLYFLHPLVAASAVCLAVIGGGVLIGMD